MSYEFTGRYSPSQIASGLQTYGSTGAAMSPEQNNPVQMPQNNQKTYTAYDGTVQPLRELSDYQMQYFNAPERGSDAYNHNLPNYLRTIDQSEQSGQQQMDYLNNLGSPLDNSPSNVWGDNPWSSGLDAASGGAWNMATPVAGMGHSAYVATRKKPSNQEPDLPQDDPSSAASEDTRDEQGGMGGNDLGDVDLTSEQNSPTEQTGNWLQKITRNPVNKDLAIMGSNLVMPGLGGIWGWNAAPTYSLSPNTTFGQKAAHVADFFVRNLPIVGTPYALATDLYRQHQAKTDEWSRPARQAEFDKWAPTVSYGNGMDMADPSYLQNQALAKAMADKGIGQQYSFTRGQ